jgi:hypothetical protein
MRIFLSTTINLSTFSKEKRCHVATTKHFFFFSLLFAWEKIDFFDEKWTGNEMSLMWWNCVCAQKDSAKFPFYKTITIFSSFVSM